MTISLAISPSYTGVADYIVISPEGKITFTVSCPETSLIHGSAPGESDLIAMAKICRYELTDILAQHTRANFVAYGSAVPVGRTVSQATLKKALHHLHDQFARLAQDLDDHYIRTFLKMRRFLSKLQCAKIDSHRYRKAKQQNKQASQSRLDSFEPTDKGYSRQTVYAMHKTVTGRLTVKSGPQILTLKSDYRDIVCSRYQSGSVLLIDFISLEPRVLLQLQDKSPPKDIYEMVSNQVFLGRVDRARAKLATISMLYGAGEGRIRTILDIDAVTDQVGKLRAYFGVDDLERALVKELSLSDHIHNAIGRPIFPGSQEKHVLLNNFVQSTAAECAILGFDTLCRSFYDNNLKFTPLFVIHDALMIDIDDASIEHAVNIINAGINTPLGQLPLKVTNALGEDI